VFRRLNTARPERNMQRRTRIINRDRLGDI